MVLMQNNLRMLKKSVQQDRRELGDRSVFLLHPPTPSCQDSSVTGGVRCRETGD
jgi:hypothetical protein